MRRLSFTRLSPSHQPLIFVSLAFLGGLLFAAKFTFSIRAWFFVALMWWLAAGVCLWKRQTVAMAMLLAGCIAAGGLLWAINEKSGGETGVRSLFARGELKSGESVELFGTINDSPELAPERIHLSVEAERVFSFGREHKTRGVIAVVVPLNDEISRQEFDQLRLDYGSQVRLLAVLNNRGGYQNPGAPDFDEMLEFNGFDAAGSVKSPLLIERLGEAPRNRFLGWLYRLRARAIAVCLGNFRQPASGILVAAVFGNRHFLDRSTAEIFRAGGTFHLLVISGLHVAMLALAVMWLTAKLIRVRWLQFALVVAVMWAYALMVGAQPSVTRAVVMLSAVLVGQLIFRTSPGANTLATAAMFLLAWQPRDLFSPGFQLSFLTVLMIVVIVAPLYRRLQLIGQWQPSAKTPYPPRVPKPVKLLAEILFWNEREFRREMEQAHVRFHLQKSAAARWLNRWRLQSPLVWIVGTVFTTTVIQIGLLPLMITHFHRVSIVSPVANVIESVLVSALMLAGIVCLLLYAVVGSLALKLAWAINWLGWLTVKAGEPLLAWRKASLRVPDWSESPVLVYAAFFAAVLVLVVLVNEWNPFGKGDESPAASRRLVGKIAFAVASSVLVVLTFLLVVHPFDPQFERGRLSVTFLDVGQGDSMLLVFPAGKTMLLDSGGRLIFDSDEEVEFGQEVFVEDSIGIAEAAVMPALWRRGIKRLDWIAASHGDADHTEGFGDIVRSFEIGQVVRAFSPLNNSPTDLFDQAVRSAGLSVWCVRANDAFEIDGVRIEILSPTGDAGSAAMSSNNQSLVLRVSFGARSFLLTGDIEKEAEARLVAAADLKTDVLKIAHHGSRTSTTAEFLERTMPQHAVISVADSSPYGHPHAEIIERLQTAGANIWRTSQCGAITISTDGNDLRVKTFLKCESDEQAGGNGLR
ncbi:MAG: ComEC/Rec2 family competence protein [Acidobacteriota bacterium]|nr:ComEC/Rec2 family competence protein [Acidobacteriota bacterium]